MKYRVIIADPPYPAYGGGKIKRGADRHYRLMKISDIVALSDQVKAFSEDDSLIFLWTPAVFLKDAFHILQEWGFTYITNIVWVKDRIGLGGYFRGKHELCLVGRRGNTVPLYHDKDRKKFPSVINAPTRGHSVKPDELYEIAESFCEDGDNKLELFARRGRQGWDSIGDELGTEL